MNGIVFLTLTVAFQGGIEFGWTQLPDDRIEYIIQLDDEAIEALKNGQPLTSSIPPEVSQAARIRIQYGAGALNKPVLSRKPQAFNGPQHAGLSNSGIRQGNPNFADTQPALKPNELNARYLEGGLLGQVTTVQGNQASVSNSTLSAARPTAFVTQETGTNRALHWNNSDRVIGNFDNQNRTADSRSGFSGTSAGTNNGAATGTNSNLNNTNNGTGFSQGSGFGARTGANLERMSPVNGQTGRSQANTGLGGTGGTGMGAGAFVNGQNGTGQNGTGQVGAGQNGLGQNGTGQGTNFSGQGTGFNTNANPNFGTNGMSSVQNPAQNTGGWNSVNNPNRTNTGFPNAGAGGASSGFNPGNVNAGNVNPNPYGNNGMQQNHFPNAGFTPNTQFQTNGQGTGFVQPQTIPVSTAVNSNDAALQKVQELQQKLDARDNEEKIAKMKAESDAKLEKATEMLNDLKKKIENPKTKKQETEAAVKPIKEESPKGSSSGIANVLLVISLGLNVFLVVQYLSVQNQFRDLSNDLRDTFMTNNYE